MFDISNDILTIEEVMEILYIGRNYAYKLLNNGEINAFRVGRSWRIPRKSLEEYVIRKCSSRVSI